ncbi:hypothetical protein EC973_005582 [Apophysomyces ossiformis]|uniref:RdRp catalytic domain-containing protein n=1 Tax=Apophysomyces ossiformis TaxID=679940 RepID=A0A8H7BP92_9FUNG|nr:hypothetical protein EC973_005582 [Apophysomyces ossiformis]
MTDRIQTKHIIEPLNTSNDLFNFMDLMVLAKRRNVLPEIVRKDFAESFPYFTTKEADVAYIRRLYMNPAYGKPDPLIVKYSKDNPPPVKGLDPDEYFMVKGNTCAQMRHLELFNREDKPKPEIPELTKAYEHVLSLMDIPNKVSFPTKDKLALVPYEAEKFAGIDYALKGLVKRRQADSLAQQEAKAAYDRLMAGVRVEPHRVRMGGKGKYVHEEQFRKDPCVGRMILMTSHRDLKLNGITENVLTEAYLDDRYPIALGMSWWHGGCDRFIKRFLGYDQYYCMDARKFDANINGWMVRMAIDVVRRQFLNGADSGYDTYWDFVYEGMVQPTIYRDDGLAFQKHVGSNSGHPHNSLLQSIITLIIAYASLLLLNPGRSAQDVFAGTWVESLGDDNIIAVKDKSQLCTTGLAEVTMRYFGIDWSGKKSFHTKHLLHDHFAGVQFLGKYFRKPTELDGEAYKQGSIIPFRPAHETYLKLYFEPDRFALPEEPQEKLRYSYMRALGHWYDCAGNHEMRKWLDGYLDWLERFMTNPPPEEWASEILQWFLRGHRGMEVPKCGRITYEKWVHLVVSPLP